jgi:hypothetical protein
MDDIEALVEALHTLDTRVETLRGMEGVKLLLPGRIENYHKVLDDAYAAYELLETIIDVLGQDLKKHRTRLDKDVKLYGP